MYTASCRVFFAAPQQNIITVCLLLLIDFLINIHYSTSERCSGTVDCVCCRCYMTHLLLVTYSGIEEKKQPVRYSCCLARATPARWMD